MTTHTATFSQTLDNSTKTSDIFNPLDGGQAFGFSFGVEGTFVADLRLQMSSDAGTTWIDFLIVDQPDVIAIPTQAPLLWRASWATGSDFTSGSATIQFEKGGQQAGIPIVRLATKDRRLLSYINALPVAAPRAAIVNGIYAHGQTSYAANKCIGGLVTIPTGLPAGTIISPKALLVGITLRDLITTLQVLNVQVFEGNPTASTLTDNATTALNAADVTKAARFGSPGFAGATGQIGYWAATPPSFITVDASGNIYFSASSSVSSLVFTDTGNLGFRFEFNY